MDRIDAMTVFVAALDEGSLAGAGRKLGRSPAAVSRAVAFLEEQVGAELLHRTTRSSKLSEVGERFAQTCRRLLTDLKEAETIVASHRKAPGGTLAFTAPVLLGEEVLRPLLDEFLDAFPTVSAKITLLDRTVNLLEEGIDAALRIGHLPDSSMVAVRLGEVRQVVAAAPSYLDKHPPIETPADLTAQRIISFSHAELDTWRFPPLAETTIPRVVHFTPRIAVNSARAAVASAVEARGVTRLYSYHVADQVRDGRLRVVLRTYEFPPVPVHLVMPEGRIAIPKVRAFVDFMVPRLRKFFGRGIDYGD
ncbi:MAG TPA: LysR family transcriptional regulator [Acetobacteraceae bacterium]|nr:LysR family transcriptional regulator [Acetobacteraceae bacterium]